MHFHCWPVPWPHAVKYTCQTQCVQTTADHQFLHTNLHGSASSKRGLGGQIHTHARMHPHPDTVTHAQKLACTHSSINYEYFSARKLLMLNTELCETFETLHYISSSASFFLSLYLSICTFHVLSSGFASATAVGMSLYPFSLSFSFVFQTDSSAAEWLHFNTNFRSSKKLRKWFELLYD